MSRAITAEAWNEPRREPAPTGRSMLLALALALGIAMGAGGSAVADALSDAWSAREAARLAEMEAALRWPAPPLPVEWRWSPPSPDVDRMFMQRGRVGRRG